MKYIKKIAIVLSVILSTISADTATLNGSWNLIGVNANTSLYELKEQLGESNILVVQGGGKVYKKSNPSFINDFTNFKQWHGYWVKLDTDAILEYTAITYEDKTVELSSGWNLINPITNLTLSEIQEQVGADNLEVIQGGADIYKKSNPSALNDFTQFEEPFGYWVKVSEDTSLTFALIKRFNLEDTSGVAIDTVTNLMWQNSHVAHKTPEAAAGYCSSLTLAGYDDWILPSKAQSKIFHFEMNKQGDVPNQAFSRCTAENVSDGSVRTKQGAIRYGGQPGDSINFRGGANVRCYRENVK